MRLIGENRDEIEAKARNLAAYGRVKDKGHLDATKWKIWSLETEASMLGFAFKRDINKLLGTIKSLKLISSC